MKQLIAVLLTLLIQQSLGAQTRYTLNGYIKDSSSGESVVSATIAVKGRTVTSNQYGF